MVFTVDEKTDPQGAMSEVIGILMKSQNSPQEIDACSRRIVAIITVIADKAANKLDPTLSEQIGQLQFSEGDPRPIHPIGYSPSASNKPSPSSSESHLPPDSTGQNSARGAVK